MTEYWVWGGYSYSVSTETFTDILDAAQEYLRRMAPSNLRYPTWGDAPDEYVITTEHDGWKIEDLIRIVETAQNEQENNVHAD
jgi:hypothetical protein